MTIKIELQSSDGKTIKVTNTNFDSSQLAGELYETLDNLLSVICYNQKGEGRIAQ